MRPSVLKLLSLLYPKLRGKRVLRPGFTMVRAWNPSCRCSWCRLLVCCYSFRFSEHDVGPRHFFSFMDHVADCRRQFVAGSLTPILPTTATQGALLSSSTLESGRSSAIQISVTPSSSQLLNPTSSPSLTTTSGDGEKSSTSSGTTSTAEIIGVVVGTISAVVAILSLVYIIIHNKRKKAIRNRPYQEREARSSLAPNV